MLLARVMAEVSKQKRIWKKTVDVTLPEKYTRSRYFKKGIAFKQMLSLGSANFDVTFGQPFY